MRVGGWDCEEFRALFLISISVSVIAVDEKRLGQSVRAAERVFAAVLPQVPRQGSVPAGRRVRVPGVAGRGPRAGRRGAEPGRGCSRSPEGLPGSSRGLLFSRALEEPRARCEAAVLSERRALGRQVPGRGSRFKIGEPPPSPEHPPSPGARISLPARGDLARGSSGAVRSPPRLPGAAAEGSVTLSVMGNPAWASPAPHLSRLLGPDGFPYSPTPMPTSVFCAPTYAKLRSYP